MKILVTGGSGMVGSELVKILPNAVYPSSKDLNLTDPHSVETFLKKNKFDYVIHLAAHVGSLHDNIENSTLYFDQNGNSYNDDLFIICSHHYKMMFGDKFKGISDMDKLKNIKKINSVIRKTYIKYNGYPTFLDMFVRIKKDINGILYKK